MIKADSFNLIFISIILWLYIKLDNDLNLNDPNFSSEIAKFKSIFYSQCKQLISSNLTDALLILKRKECIWAKIWKEISHMNENQICSLLFVLFPSIYKSKYTSFRSYFYSKSEIDHFDSNFFEAEKNIDWPDESYKRMMPKDWNYDKRKVIMGQKYIQHEIWRRQHPTSCEKVNFCLMKSRKTGFGSAIHSYSIIMGYCLSQENTVFAYVPGDKDTWAKGSYCHSVNNLSCFFEPLTNCSVPTDREELKRRSFIKTRGKGYNTPPFAKEMLNKSLVPSEYHDWYWLMSAATYLTRLNQRTVDWLDSYEQQNLINNRPSYDVGIHVRHGDKYTEMTLVKAKNYMPSIEIFKKISGKKVGDITVFLSTEDQSVVDWFVNNSGCSLSYFKFIRSNPDKFKMMQMGDELTLHSLANLRVSLRTRLRVDTFASNWDRLILELMNTVAENADVMSLEMGIMRSLSAEHYSLLKKWNISENWSFLQNKKAHYEPDDP